MTAKKATTIPESPAVIDEATGTVAVREEVDAMVEALIVEGPVTDYFSAEVMGAFKSWTDLDRYYASQKFVEEEYGKGFIVLSTKEKERFTGVAFRIISWVFRTGDKGPYVSAAIITEDGRKFILNDGGTGIRAQLARVTVSRLAENTPNRTLWTRETAQAGLRVPGGLRRSDFDYTDKLTGDVTPATVMYLAE
jgi:hypothetical protein